MLKLIFLFFKLVILAAIVLAGLFFYQFKVQKEEKIVWNDFVLTQENGCCQIELAGEKGDLLKGLVKKINGWIYYEATIHNPEGDMLPDQIDEQIKERVKDYIK